MIRHKHSERIKRSILSVIVTIFGLMLFIGCSNTAESGLLQGKVNIGPISPVEQPGDSTPIRCDVYEARKIMVYDKNRTKLIKQVDIDCNSEENYATYRIELKPGTYTVDINNIGIDHSNDVPKEVEIKSGQTTRLDIDIDTGIR